MGASVVYHERAYASLYAWHCLTDFLCGCMAEAPKTNSMRLTVVHLEHDEAPR